MEKRDFLSALGSAIVAIPTAALTVKATQQSVQQKENEPAFARVLKTGTLRCGYGFWAPGFMKDPNTGIMSGIFHDFIESLGKQTGLKIEWVAEIPWADYPAALNSGRIDIMCFGAWPKANLARDVLFSESTYYLPIYAYARINDTRFDGSPDTINSPSVTLSVMDGELSSELAALQFPQAKTLSVSQLSDAGTLLLNVATGKADVTFTDAWTGATYMKQNPNQIRIIALPRPLRLFGHTVPVGRGEHSLLSLINTATNQIVSTGEFANIVNTYVDMPGVLLMEKPTLQ